MKFKFRTIDLCAGIGGIRKGFEMTGCYKNVMSAEIDMFARLTYEHLYGETPCYDLTSDMFKNALQKEKYEVLLAGFPCQTFSRAGKGEGFSNKTKGTIFWHIADIIKKTRPKGIFLENVDNLVRHDKGNTIRIIINTLERELNYKVIGVKIGDDGKPLYEGKDFIRNSRNFGVPQNRPRTYIMAFNRNKYSARKLAALSNELPQGNKLNLYTDLNDLLEFKAPAEYYLSSGYFETLKKHRIREKGKGNGFGYKVVNAKGIEHPVANTIMATGGSGKERNLVYDPQPGIAGKLIPTKMTPLNSEGIRLMTPREWGKLQGFIGYAFKTGGKDNFSFPAGVSKCQQYKQFGNSVTIPVIKTLADFMTNCFRTLGEDL